MNDTSKVPALEVKNVSLAFDRRKLKKGNSRSRKKNSGLFDISFELIAGNALAIVGPSASGKTTLGLACAGLIAPHSGFVRHFGVDLYASGCFNWRLQSRAFMVFQDPYSSINPRRTVLSWLLKAQHALPITTAVKRDKAMQILESVNLSAKHLPKYPGQLSGGECQRVVIAAGLLSKAKILIFDEPTSMLDPIAKRELLILLKRIHSEFNVASIVVTHDIPAAMSLCESALVLSEGRIIARGTFFKLKSATETLVQQLLQFS